MSEFMISTFNYFNESLTEILKNVFGMSLNIIVKNFAQFPEIKRNSEHCNAFEMHHALESVIFLKIATRSEVVGIKSDCPKCP